MSETRKCAKCHNSGWEPSELGGSVPCSCGARPNLGVLDATPTPDRAAVREALVRVLENCPPHFVGRLGDHLATKRDWTCEAIADALLAAERAQEARRILLATLGVDR